MAKSATADAKRPADISVEQATSAPEHADLYARLASPFDTTFKDIRGGVELEYITGEQAVSRLNETLGVAGWDFRIVQHGIHTEADECWVLAELTATVDGRTVTRQQFGSQKIKRSRSSGTPLDIGFDLKGAATDALKKCASLIGVGLYLWKKEPIPAIAPVANGYGQGANGASAVHDASAAGDSLTCEECGEPLTETRFKDGTNWAPTQLAVFGRRKHSRILCMTHYREANQAKRRAEDALQQVPF
ncbi:MAG: hypothetical protein IT305_14035 [Chloroflexi bacterium]|nr:hypothetical protein [Chloroflexota bacterium]